MVRLLGDEVPSIRFFRYKTLEWRGHDFIVARSGWSGQDGFEIYIDNAELGQELWDELFTLGEHLNVGHGCPNNIERMEAGLLSFGSDMDYSNTPLECGLDRYCHLDADLASMSIEALRAQRDAGVHSRLVGIVVKEVPAISGHSQLLVHDIPIGDITSQTLSARYDAWLGFAMLESDLIESLKHDSSQLTLQSAGRRFDATVSELPFKLDEMDLAIREQT